MKAEPLLRLCAGIAMGAFAPVFIDAIPLRIYAITL